MAHIDDAQNARRDLEEWLTKTTAICARCGNAKPMGETRIVQEPIRYRRGRAYPGQATVKEMRVCNDC